MRWLLVKGADPNVYRNVSSECCGAGQVEHLLLQNIWGGTTLMNAASNGNAKMVELLVLAGADINVSPALVNPERFWARSDNTAELSSLGVAGSG